MGKFALIGSHSIYRLIRSGREYTARFIAAHFLRIGRTLAGGLLMSMFIERLESRELLSASPVHSRAGADIIAADKAAIVAARNAIPVTKTTWSATLKDDRASIPAVRLQDQATIKADRARIHADRGNPVLVQTDQGQLLIDQGNLKADVAAAQAKLKMDLGDEKMAIAADRKALTDAVVKLRVDRALK
jgi:hypothetical protein